ncbi:MAG: hypothetical protein ACR2H3_05570 [Acidimicrobiales bacterium]
MPDDRVPVLRLLGATLLIVGGAIHTWLAFAQYGTADLETVFFLNGAASAVVATTIVLGRGLIGPVAGIGISMASLFAFLMSRVGSGVVGFRATGLDPAPESLLTLVVEGAALVVLGLVVMADRQRLVSVVKSALPGDR